MNRKLLQLTLFLTVPAFSFAQFHWDIGGGLGASNYLGDIGGMEQTRRDFVADLKFSQTHFAGDAFVRYKINHNISVKTEFTYARISGSDNLSTNPGREGRNLSFRNDLLELSAKGEFTFFTINDVGRGYRYRDDFKAYLFAGVGGFYSNPKANYEGQWIALQPLKTEGVSYSKFGLCLPAGGGVSYTINKQHRIGWELGWRTTFTDYLDDISTVYAETSGLSPLAQKLANRNGELHYDPSTTDLPNPNNYTPGNKRGDPTHNDSYIISTINYSYVIKQKSIYSHIWDHDHPIYGKITHNKNKYGPKRTMRIKL
ncbi:MAG TPA: DUF6089 family protein [Bacteroidia bacterium]|jgi:opacity protein-like surface antigen